METENEQAVRRYEMRSFVWRWAYAVENQAARTIAATGHADREIQAHYFAIALTNLRTAVWWGRGYCDKVKDGERSKLLTPALDAFDSAVPHARDVRNIGEHFEKYAEGKGELQEDQQEKNKARRALNLDEIPLSLAIWWDASEDTVGVNVLGRRLDVAEGAAAGAALAEIALEALD
jgi:hypothetical protein